MGSPLTPYRNLLSPASQRPAGWKQPAAPQGGTFGAAPLRPAFLYGTAPAPAPRGSAGASLGAAYRLTPSQDPNAMRQAMLGILNEGVAVDLAGRNQLQNLNAGLNALSVGQLSSLTSLLGASSLKVEQIFILKAFSANEPWQNLVNYAAEMRGQPEGEIVRRSTMRDDYDVVQQWQDACGPTLLQTAAGEVDPFFSWELNKTLDISKIDPAGYNQAIAQQQKEWLEQYGGQAVQRGQTGGQGIALNQMLNDMLGPIVGAQFATVDASQPAYAMEGISQALQAGFDVPLRVSWDRPGGADSGHFVLAMAVRGQTGNRELQIHDPWTGKTAWVNERNMQNNSFSPIFENFTRLTHYYAPQPAMA